jgi:hypothetical protein
MPRGFIREQIFSTMIDRERWLVLETKGRRDWNLRVVGPEPLDVDLVELTAQEAKDWAVGMAKEHFRAVNPRVIVARFLQWHEALFVERSYSRGSSPSGDGPCDEWSLERAAYGSRRSIRPGA